MLSLSWTIHALVVASSATVCPDGASNCTTGLPTVTASSGALQTVLQVVFGILAGIAVMLVVIGGMRYVLSAGNPQEAKKARDTIIYAVVGLVVAIIAEGIVTFVLGHVS